MPAYHPITPERHADKCWQRYSSYRFAAQDAVSPLVVQELAKAMLSLPIAFIAQEDRFTPVAVQSLAPGKNFFVARMGAGLAATCPQRCAVIPSFLPTPKTANRCCASIKTAA